jgi:hypothetical protein
MFHGHLDYFQKSPLEVRPNTKLGDYGTPNAHNRCFILFYYVGGPHMNRNSSKLALVEDPLTYDLALN